MGDKYFIARVMLRIIIRILIFVKLKPTPAMATEKQISDLTDRQLMERIAENTRRSADTLIRIKNFVIMIIGVAVITLAFALVYMQHN